jgi:hypothetical protein
MCQDLDAQVLAKSTGAPELFVEHFRKCTERKRLAQIAACMRRIWG